MPAYNEEECIEEVVDSWIQYLQNNLKDLKFKFLVINDGSKDKTGTILDSINKRHPELIVYHTANGGHGNAVIFGYEKALELNAKYIFQTDSDDQFSAADFTKLWEKRMDSDFILGHREQRHDPPFRIFVTNVLKYSLYFIYGTFIKDSNVPFRLIESKFLQKMVNQLPKPAPFAPNIFLSVMAKRADKKTFDIPIQHKERDTGVVSIQKMKLLKVCWQSFKELLFFRINLNEISKELKK